MDGPTTQFSTTQPTTVQITVMPSPLPPATQKTDSTSSLAIIALLVSVISLWNSNRQRRIADQQRKLAEQKFRLDLFDARFAVYTATRNSIDLFVTVAGPVEKDSLINFVNSTHAAEFLFDSDVTEYLSALHDVFAERRTLLFALRNVTRVEEQQAAERKSMLSVINQKGRANEVFARYLDFGQLAKLPPYQSPKAPWKTRLRWWIEDHNPWQKKKTCRVMISRRDMTATTSDRLRRHLHAPVLISVSGSLDASF